MSHARCCSRNGGLSRVYSWRWFVRRQCSRRSCSFGVGPVSWFRRLRGFSGRRVWRFEMGRVWTVIRWGAMDTRPHAERTRSAVLPRWRCPGHRLVPWPRWCFPVGITPSIIVFLDLLLLGLLELGLPFFGCSWTIVLERFLTNGDEDRKVPW